MTPERRHRRFAAALLACLGPLLAADRAHAYCRTSACEELHDDWHVCSPTGADDCGIPLFRARPRVTYSIQKDASKLVGFEEMQSIVQTAFDTWTHADCGDGKRPRIEVIEGEPAVCADVEYNKHLGNANIVVFRDEAWPNDPSDLALTTVTYDEQTGEIYDADIELNSDGASFTTTDNPTDLDVDLASVLTHEAGHFLGLAHAQSAEAVMYYHASPGLKRSLTDDDRAGICAIYPPGPIADGCPATPRHGASPLCGADQTNPPEDVPEDEGDDAERCCCPEDSTCSEGVCHDAPEGCCALAPGARSAGSRSAAALAAVGLAALAARRRRRSRGKGPSRTIKPPGR